MKYKVVKYFSILVQFVLVFFFLNKFYFMYINYHNIYTFITLGKKKKKQSLFTNDHTIQQFLNGTMLYKILINYYTII